MHLKAASWCDVLATRPRDGGCTACRERVTPHDCSANSTGGVMGKMIDAQSIVVSAIVTNQPGR